MKQSFRLGIWRKYRSNKELYSGHILYNDTKGPLLYCLQLPEPQDIVLDSHGIHNLTVLVSSEPCDTMFAVLNSDSVPGVSQPQDTMFPCSLAIPGSVQGSSWPWDTIFQQS